MVVSRNRSWALYVSVSLKKLENASFHLQSVPGSDMVGIHRYMRRDPDEDILSVMPSVADAGSTRAGSTAPLEQYKGYALTSHAL